MGDIDPVSGHIAQLQRALTDARGKATSADGAVLVEVGANGTLHKITVGDGGADLDPRRLAEMIVDLHREAVADAAAVMREAVAALGSDPRMQENRQDVVDKLAQPRPIGETSGRTAPSPPETTGSVDTAANPPESAVLDGPRDESPLLPAPPTEPAPASAPRQPGITTAHLPTSGTSARTTPATAHPMAARQRPATRARLSEFDPVTFAPVTRTRRTLTPGQPTDRPHRPTPAAEPTTTTESAPDPVPTSEHSAAPPERRTEPATDLTEHITAWGDPADDPNTSDENWPPDDHLTLSGEWWGLPSTDGR
ncbi:YbaB/EbfC family nucleoid-associated protein [Nocardia sp. NPDC059177]|uniref:YbaB/EbfC family nucleoid-associated protein n=1 Tax=Nocardia sp. NPDC059177 TaxID=3346759 RepID=UPI00368EA101